MFTVKSPWDAYVLVVAVLSEIVSLQSIVVPQPGLQKVGIRGIQIRAKFKILGAKIVARPSHIIGSKSQRPEILEPRLTCFQSQIQPNVWLSETDGRFTIETPGAYDNHVSNMIRSVK